MNIPVRVLHLEDNPMDAKLVRATMEREGLECEVVNATGQKEFEGALVPGRFDVILADFSLPNYNGFSALDFARRNAPEVPFILVTGTLGEELAVQSLKTGATDYVLKQRLHRLVPAVQRALQEAQERAGRKEAEAALRQTEEWFRMFMDNSPLVAFIKNEAGNFVYIDRTFERLFQTTLEQLQAKTDCDLWPPEVARQLREQDQAVLETDQTIEAFHDVPLPDGTIHHWLIYKFPIEDAAGQRYVGGVAADITERRVAEERIREQAALLDKAQDAILVRDLEGRICYWNKGAERVYGWSVAEVMGKNADDLLSNQSATQLTEARQEVITRGEWLGELRPITKDGKAVIIESHWTLVRDNAGNPKSVLVIGTNVTEKRKLEAQFLRAQRMESIGALAGGIAHDLNNVLAPILMVVDLVQSELATDESRRLLAMAKSSALRGAGMVKQILSFARGLGGEFTALHLEHLVREMGKLANDTFPRSIRIETQIGKGLCPIKGDATQLHQVLMNLCVNARDAMPDGGSLCLEVENAILDGRQTPMLPEPASGPYVVLTVADTGQGIPARLLDKIFEPFFTTKEPDKGTGLGLSTVMGILKTHNGFLEVSSEVGKGTTFHIFLPAVAAGATVSPVERPGASPLGQGEQILLVDDETALLEITRELLGAFNYRVLTATDGEEAVALYRRHRGNINAVVTDMMMPTMDGPATIRALREIDPQVKVLCMSGLDSRPNLADAGQLRVEVTLRKPFPPETLLTKLRQVLDVEG